MVAGSPEGLLGVGAVCVSIAAISYRKRLLDGTGIAAAVVTGLVIGVLGDPVWLFVLLVYMVSSFAATKYRFDKKVEMGVAEGKRGERTWRNVVANGAAPAGVAALAGLAPWALPPPLSGYVFLTAIAVAASDTLASEIGVLSPRTVLITKPSMRVTPGTDGGVSLLGQAAALVAVLYVAAIGYAAFALFAPSTLAPRPLLLAVPVAFGFAGCQVDSVMGATLELEGKLTKGWVNFLSIALMTACGWAVLLLTQP